MTGLNNAAMVVGANAIKAVISHAQLHTAAAGGSGTSNVSSAARQAITWSSTTSNGDWGLASTLNFTGGTAGGPIYSITAWSASSSGTFYGEWLMTGDATFDALGQYAVVTLNMDGTAS